jgi:hypothetical protein
MKVIKDNRQFSFPLPLTCKMCLSELEAEEGDVKPLPDGKSGETGRYIVECPLCLVTNVVKSPDPYYNKQPK